MPQSQYLNKQKISCWKRVKGKFITTNLQKFTHIKYLLKVFCKLLYFNV